MFKLFKRILGLFRRPEYEPEHEEPVAHDTVMMMIDGKLTDVTEVKDDDSEIRQP